MAELAQPLTTQAGDVNRGQQVFIDRQRGHCLLCHQVRQIPQASQGNIGPALDDVGRRLNAAQLRLRLVDSTLINPNTVMPAYHRTHDLNQVADRYADQPVLNAQEIEDVLAFLLTLTGQADEMHLTPAKQP